MSASVVLLALAWGQHVLGPVTYCRISCQVFACGRAAGWIAHALEQRQAGTLLRPRARYVGPAAE